MKGGCRRGTVTASASSDPIRVPCVSEPSTVLAEHPWGEASKGPQASQDGKFCCIYFPLLHIMFSHFSALSFLPLLGVSQ